MNQDQIIFEKLTVEDLQRVRGGDYVPTDPPYRPNIACIP